VQLRPHASDQRFLQHGWYSTDRQVRAIVRPGKLPNIPAVRDPRLAVERLYELNEINLDELEDANDLLERMDLPLIEPKPAKKPVAVPMVAKKPAQGAG